MAKFITPVEITPGTAGSWQTVDVSSYIPAGSTGVMLHVVDTSSTAYYKFGYRKNGSTDNRTNPFYPGHCWCAIGVDTDRKLQLYVGDITYIDIYLVGYFESDAVFFTNAINKTPGTTDAWVDVSIASDTGSDTAIGAIFEVISNEASSIGFRKKGSSDDRHDAMQYHFASIIGVDANEICQVYVGSDTYPYLVGYIKSGATFNTNATDMSLSTINEWLDLTALPSGAIGGIFDIVALDEKFGLRKNGSSEDICRKGQGSGGRSWATVECDSAQLIEGKISWDTADFFLVGYFEPTIINQTITPPVATATFTAPVPSIRLNISVISPVATASFSALAPTFAGDILILPPVAIAAFTALAPLVGISKTVLVENVAQVQFAALIPTISCSYTVASPVATATFSAVAPEIFITGDVLILPPAAAAAFTALAPDVCISLVVSSPVATAVFSALIPSVGIGKTVSVENAAQAQFAALTPTISYSYTVASPVATATFTALAPDILVTGDILIMSPVANATFTALAPTIPFLTVYVENDAQAQFVAPVPLIIIKPLVSVVEIYSVTMTFREVDTNQQEKLVLLEVGDPL